MVEKGKYRLLLKNLPDAFAYHQMVTDSKGNPVDYIFLEINPAFEKMTGLQEKQVLGKRVTEVYPEIMDSAFGWIGIYGRVAAGRGDMRFESYFEPSGCWYEITAYSDAVGYFAAVFRDITKSIHFQEDLRESEENLFITLQSIGDGVIATDLNTKITRMNPQAEKLTGWTFQEAAGRPLDEVFQIVHAKTGEPAFNPVHHVLKTGEILKLANDTALIARDGNRYQIADSAAPIRDGKGRITGAIMVFSDVTEQYRARKALEETTQRLEHIIRATHTGIDIIDQNFNLQYVDSLWQNVYGAYEGRKCYEYFKDRTGPCENCGAPRALETKEVAVSEQILPKENDRVVACHTVPFQNEEGEWLVAEFKTDITKHKQTERALRESEENLSITLHSIGDGVIATDLKAMITRMNPQAEKLTGWTFQEAAGRPLDEVFCIINARTGEPAFNPVHHVLKTGETLELANDTALISRDGTKYQIGDSAAPIRDTEGKIAGAIMVFSNVTEQYTARKTLEKSEARYRTIVENINDALFIHNFQGKILDLNETACRLLGYERDGLLGTNLSTVRSDEEQKRTPLRLEQLLRRGKLLFEGELIHKSGLPIPVEVSQKIVSREGDGLIQSFVRDITERKQNEQQITDYTSKLEKLYQKLDAEMNKAREVHERTLPKELPVIKGISLAAHYQPAERLGGDFYDVVQQGNKLVIYLSDVTGHGADGAMLSVFVKHTIKGYLSFAPEECIRPEKILRYLSNQFHQKDLPEEYFICTFLAVLDLETRELTYTAAGFQDAPLIKLGSGERSKLVSKGLFLSPAFSDELLNLQEKSICLTPGTTIFFNTDGLTEQGTKDVYYGMLLPGVFYEHSHLSPELIAQIVREDFRKFNGGSLQGNDDITFLILQVDPNPKIIKHLELASDFAELEHLRIKVSGFLGNHKEAGLFLACLHELTSNAIEHGNRLDQEKKVSVEIVITERFIQGSVEDQGEGFNWREQIDKPLELEGAMERGRGIAMARICSKQLLYNDKGNRAIFVLKGLKEDNNHAN